MAEAVYILCFLTSGVVAFLLLRAYVRTRTQILLLCGLGFIGLCLNNLLLIADVIVFPLVNITPYRNLPALLGMMLLLYGLIWKNE